MKFPKISLVIGAYNEEKDIGSMLDSVMTTGYPKEKIEVIVVDDGSTDKTLEILKKYKIKIIRGPHKGVGYARNLGWKKAKNEIVIFLDADYILDKNYIKEITKPFSNPKVGGVCHRIIGSRNRTLIAKLLHLRNVLGIEQYGFAFARAVRKKILKKIGGFNPIYGYYDDWELTIRIIENGYKVVWEDKAKILHNEPETFYEMWKQQKWAGRSSVFLFKGYTKYAIQILRFPILCAGVPFYIIFLFLPFPLWFIGFSGLAAFIIVELQRTLKMYKLTKMKESFLTFSIDIISMLMFCLAILIGLITIKTKPKA